MTKRKYLPTATCHLCGFAVYTHFAHTCPSIGLSDYGPYRQRVVTVLQKDKAIMFDYRNTQETQP